MSLPPPAQVHHLIYKRRSTVVESMLATRQQSPLDAPLEKLCGGKPSQTAVGEQPEVVVTTNATTPPLHALIIGINDYAANSKLEAAVADAGEFKSFLMNDLHVPEDQITIILDQQATRINIISAFQNLAKNPRIQKDDPIVIYYAGHGSEIKPPPDRAVNGPLVQCIIPQDTSKDTGVIPIPDFTIGALLSQLANEKGNNITVIFDCCHSASGSRDREGGRYVDKENLPSLPAEPDAEIIEAATGSRALVEVDGFFNTEMTSHVMLAACAHGEVAYENPDTGHGFYSLALLTFLRNSKVDNLTYKGCMQRLPTLATKQPQNPVCEGKNIDRIFFNAKVPGAVNKFIAIKPDDSGRYYLQAGHAQGISPGCTFAVYTDHIDRPNNVEIGTLVVDKAEPFRSLMKLPEGAKPLKIETLAYGCQTGYGADHAFNVYITDAFVKATKQDEKWRTGFTGGENNIVLCPTEEDLAHLILDVNDEGQATFTTTNSSARAHGIQTLPHTVMPTAEEVLPVLHAAARWSYHLRRMPGSRPFQKDVQMEFYKLRQGEAYDAQVVPVLEPVGENLNMGGEADIIVPDPGPGEEPDTYGFNIINNSSRDLFAYLFLFSVTDQAIIPCFTRIIGNDKVDPNLPVGVPLTLGYGSTGQTSMSFELKGADLDLGIFKLFLTTESTDFDSLEQDPLFADNRARLLVEETNEVERIIDKLPLWDVITMTLVQRRYP